MAGLGELFESVERSGDGQTGLVMPREGAKFRKTVLRLAEMQSAATDWITLADFRDTYSNAEGKRLPSMLTSGRCNAVQRRSSDDRAQYRIAPEFYDAVRDRLGELDASEPDLPDDYSYDDGTVVFEGGERSNGHADHYESGERAQLVREFFEDRVGEWVGIPALTRYADDRMDRTKASTALSQAYHYSELPVERRKAGSVWEYRNVIDDDFYEWLVGQPDVGATLAVNIMEAGYRSIEDVAGAASDDLHGDVEYMKGYVARNIVQTAGWHTPEDGPPDEVPDLPDDVEAEAEAPVEELENDDAVADDEGEYDDPPAPTLLFDVDRESGFAVMAALIETERYNEARQMFDSLADKADDRPRPGSW